MSDETYPYISSPTDDGGIVLEGPLSPESLNKRRQELFKAKKAATTTYATTKGKAILNAILATVDYEKQKPK